MNVRPEDRTKVIVLAVALVAVVGLIAMTILREASRRSQQASMRRPTSTASNPTAPPGGIIMPGQNGAPVAAAMANNEVPLDEIAESSPFPAASGVDPFRVVVRVGKTSMFGTVNWAEKNQRKAAGAAGGGSAGGVGGSGGSVAPMGVEPPESAQVEVKGVILGGQKLAVVRHGDKVSYAREGEALRPGLRVQSISSSGVVFRFYRREIFLAVGASKALGAAPVPGPIGQPVPAP
jgi:hypothetical protein